MLIRHDLPLKPRMQTDDGESALIRAARGKTRLAGLGVYTKREAVDQSHDIAMFLLLTDREPA